MSSRDRSRLRPKADAPKAEAPKDAKAPAKKNVEARERSGEAERVAGAEAVRSALSAELKGAAREGEKKPPAPPRNAKSAGDRKSVPPAKSTARRSVPPAPPSGAKATEASPAAPAVSTAAGAGKTVAPARRNALMEVRTSAREQAEGKAPDSYWNASTAAAKPSARAKGKPRSLPPLGDLRSGVEGILKPSLETISFEAGIAPSPAEAVTLVPPARKARSSEPRVAKSNEPPRPLGDAPDTQAPDTQAEDEIWSDDPAATREALVEAADSTREQHATRDDQQESAARLIRGSASDPLRAAAEFGSAQSLLSTDYYFRQYGAHGMRSLAAEVDDFGFDPHVDAKLKPLLELVCQRYFRVELVGAEQLPAAGRSLLVANRGGTLPWDGLVLRSAIRDARPELSALRWLAEDSVIHYPFMGVLMNRLGAVRACPENAERLLAQDRMVAVFPEGAQGSRKLFRDRYRLQRFGRGGYVKLALKLGVPILPTAIIGAEDTNPVLRRSRLLGRLVGSDSVPITPTFPWLGLAGLLPAPVRWRIAIGEPIDLSSYGPDAAEDALIVHRLNEQVRSALQSLVDQHKEARGSSLFG